MECATPPDRPITWQAARGRFVVLVKAQSWFDARDIARAMLGGEPEYVEAKPRRVCFDSSPLIFHELSERVRWARFRAQIGFPPLEDPFYLTPRNIHRI